MALLVAEAVCDHTFRLACTEDDRDVRLMGMKTDHSVIELARDKLSVEQIAATLHIKPHTVFKTGRRLGIYFPPLVLKPNGRRKTKSA